MSAAADAIDLDPAELAVVEADRLSERFGIDNIDLGGLLEHLWLELMAREMATPDGLVRVLLDPLVQKELVKRTVWDRNREDLVALHGVLGEMVEQIADRRAETEARRLEGARREEQRQRELREREFEAMTEARREEFIRLRFLRAPAGGLAHLVTMATGLQVATACGVRFHVNSAGAIHQDAVDLVSGWETGPHRRTPAGLLRFCRRCSKSIDRASREAGRRTST